MLQCSENQSGALTKLARRCRASAAVNAAWSVAPSTLNSRVVLDVSSLSTASVLYATCAVAAEGNGTANELHDAIE